MWTPLCLSLTLRRGEQWQPRAVERCGETRAPIGASASSYVTQTYLITCCRAPSKGRQLDNDDFETQILLPLCDI